jgi:hypothetical protein
MNTKTFAALKQEAETASSNVELFRIVKQAGDKLHRNISKAQLMSYTHGMAADASYYFEHRIPVWQTAVNEINALWTAAVRGKSAQEIVAIIMEATDQKLAA